jgi:DNA polymerase alpha subunit B
VGARFDGMLPTTTPGRASALKRKQGIHETPPRGKTSRALDTSSPIRTPTKNGTASVVEPITPFSKRRNANETIEVLNPHIQKPTLPLPDASYTSRVRFLFNMEIKNFAYRPMYQKLTEASETQDERIDEFAAAIQERYSLSDEAFGDPSATSPSEIVAVGRIVSDSLEGRFNPSSVLLESSRMTGAGARTPLKLDKVQRLAFFPGQILAVKGVNSSGLYFQVNEVLEPPKLPPASSTTDDLADAAQRLSAGPLSIFIASGPYTTDDSLQFEALEELCNNAVEQQPDVVIFSGPFIDSEHPLIQAGDFDLEGVDEMNDGTVEHLFRERITKQISRIKSSMVIIIPSLRDAVSKHLAFPQDRFNKKGLELLNVTRPHHLCYMC